jgi:hypothetical protein
LRGEIEAFLSPQVLYEFFAVVTNSKRVENPMLLREAADLCIDLWECRGIEKLNPLGIAPFEVFRFAKEFKLSKGGVFDCVLAVAARESDVRVVYAENISDF